MRLFKIAIEENKCGCCNWATSYLWVLANNKDEALELYKQDVAGLCADCMCDLLCEEKYEVVSK